LDNYIAVEDPPNDMYGKLMSLPDALMMDYFKYLTDVADGELEEMDRSVEEQSENPMEFKKRLARDITGQFHTPDAARSAEQYFEQVVQRKEAPTDDENFLTVVLTGDATTSDVLIMAGLAQSQSDAKRLINQGGVKKDGVTVSKNDGVGVGATIHARHQFIKTVADDRS